MKRIAIAFTLLVLCGLSAFSQQHVFIQLKDTTLEFKAWEVRQISFAPVTPLNPPAASDAVDLGLSVKWSSYNLGASTSGESGYLVGWGDPTGQVHSDDPSYFPKRIVDFDIVGSEFDIAHKMWGDKWRLPSQSEIQELIDNCRWEWNGQGYTVTGRNNNSIFFPVVGHLKNGTDAVGAPSYYWSGMHSGNDNASVLSFVANNRTVVDVPRYFGCAVRPVYGEYRLPVTVSVSDATNVKIHSADVNVTFSGYLKDVAEYGLQYATTMDSITRNLAKKVIINPSSVVGSQAQKVTLDGLSEGTSYFYRAYATSADLSSYSDVLQFETKNRFPVPAYVDLGLPSGFKWATWNLGALSETDACSYVGWGDITGDLTPDNRSNDYAVGNTSSNIAGNPKYDIVNAKWGGYWRMPTRVQWQELANSNYTTWEFVSNYQGSGHTGYVITSVKYPDRKIFLPSAGFKSQLGKEEENSSAYYWSSEYDLAGTVAYAAHVYSPNDVGIQSYSKNFGFPVRGIYAEPKSYPADSTVAKNVKVLDLGLSVDWADQNIKSVGNPSQDAYFSWGNTQEQTSYSLSNYPYANTTISEDETLPVGKDAAAQLWGGTWRMPTIDEMVELVNSCTWSLATENGVNGWRGTSKVNGNTIFMPFDGYKVSSDLANFNSSATYWTSTDYTKTDPNENAYAGFFTQSQQFVSSFARSNGCPIRPVRAKRR